MNQNKLLFLVGIACLLIIQLRYQVDCSIAAHRSLQRLEMQELFASNPQINCTTCIDKSSCCGDEKCCGVGDSCCPNNSTCCSDVCCDSSQETCCGPQYGESGVCCISQTSFCCPPVSTYKSRCCPRWTICCTFESDGCCDPALMDYYQWKSTQLTTSNASISVSSMFARGANGLLEGVVIDSGTGAQSGVVKIPDFDTFGEATQIFMYDSAANLFYLLRANYSAPAPFPIFFYSVDPSSGRVLSLQVSGASGQVTGYAYLQPQGVIVFATLTSSGYNFYKLPASPQPASADAVFLSSFTNSPDQPDLWTGYISAISQDGTLLYRVGYQNAVTGAFPGFGTTDISTPTASTRWTSPVSLPPRLSFYQTASLLNATAFISLAANQDSGNLALVTWDVSGSTSDVVAEFSNAHAIPIYGSIAQYTDGKTFTALVALGKKDPLYDLWELVTVDLATKAVSSVTLNPQSYAGANPLSGIGIPLNQDF